MELISRRYSASLVALVLSLTAVKNADAQCAVSRLAKVDPTHPCEFIRISEVEKRDTTWLLFGRRSFTRDARKDSVNTSKEVDLNSNIHIGYREQDFPVGLAIGIEAFLRHDKTEVPIAVPGYSMIGEEKKHAELRAISANDVRYRVNVLLRAKGALDSALAESNAAKKLAQDSENARKKAASELKKVQDTIEILTQDSLKRAYTLEKFIAAEGPAETTGIKSARDDLATTSKLLNAKRAEHFAASLEAARTTDASGLIAQSSKEALARILEIIRGQYQATAVIKSLKDPANQSLLRIMSLVAKTPIEVLTSDLASVERSFATIDSISPSADTATLRKAVVKHASAITTAIVDLARNDTSYAKGNPDYDAAVASLLPSTDIALYSNNAAPGDRVIIRVTTVDLHEHRRVTDFAVDVVAYGITHGIMDSFLLLRRPVERGIEAKLIRSRAAEYLGTKGLERDLLSPVVDVPIKNDLTPTAGVTYGWTWHPRESQNIARKWGRALHPGWGINVSFPSYRTKQITIVPPDTLATTVSAASVEPKSNEVSKDLAIGLGAVGSLLDGALQLSVGRILTAPSHKWYWGLGVSFVGLTTAGKELYEKLSNQH